MPNLKVSVFFKLGSGLAGTAQPLSLAENFASWSDFGTVLIQTTNFSCALPNV